MSFAKENLWFNPVVGEKVILYRYNLRNSGKIEITEIHAVVEEIVKITNTVYEDIYFGRETGERIYVRLSYLDKFQELGLCMYSRYKNEERYQYFKENILSIFSEDLKNEKKKLEEIEHNVNWYTDVISTLKKSKYKQNYERIKGE